METKGNYVKNRTVADLKLKNHESQSTVTSEILLMEHDWKLKKTDTVGQLYHYDTRWTQTYTWYTTEDRARGSNSKRNDQVTK